MTLEQYYRARGLSIRWLYNTRRQLQRKGVVMPEPSEQDTDGDTAKR